VQAANFTIKSLQAWQWAANSVHYLLSLWERLIQSIPYVLQAWSNLVPRLQISCCWGERLAEQRSQTQHWSCSGSAHRRLSNRDLPARVAERCGGCGDGWASLLNAGTDDQYERALVNQKKRLTTVVFMVDL
jgi:hypothetical protein